MEKRMTVMNRLDRIFFWTLLQLKWKKKKVALWKAYYWPTSFHYRAASMMDKRGSLYVTFTFFSKLVQYIMNKYQLLWPLCKTINKIFDTEINRTERLSCIPNIITQLSVPNYIEEITEHPRYQFQIFQAQFILNFIVTA